MAFLETLSSGFTALLALLSGLTATPVPTLTGYAEANTVRVAPELSGRLVSLAVTRGKHVAAGDPLFRQDDTNDSAALVEAQARLDIAQAQLANLLTGKRPAEIEVLTAQLREAEAQHRLNERQLTRRTELAARNVASTQDLDIAKANLEATAARMRSLAAQITVARLPAREAEITAAEAQITVARAGIAQAQWRVSQRTVAAPAAARVDDVLHWPGEEVAAGAPVVALIPPDAIKVRFYVPEPLVGKLTYGASVSLRCDGCGPALPGHITFIASEAEYTPPVIYSTANRAKLMFLVEAYPDATPERLHPGQPVDVTLGQP